MENKPATLIMASSEEELARLISVPKLEFGNVAVYRGRGYIFCVCANPKPVLVELVPESGELHMNGTCPGCGGQLILQDGYAKYSKWE